MYGFEYTHNNLYSRSVSNRIDTSNPGLYLSEFKSLTRYPNDQATHSSLAGYFKYLKKINNYSNLNFGLRLSNNRVNLGWDFNSEEFLKPQNFAGTIFSKFTKIDEFFNVNSDK